MSQTSSAVRGAEPGPRIADVESSLANIREALLSLRYGSILVTVHEGRIVQIDVTEKTRLKAS